jgi:protein NrfD
MYVHDEQASKKQSTYIDITWNSPPEGNGGTPSQYRGETYYGMPAIKSSHYGWLTGAAFLSEGVGGAAQYMATIVDLFGEEEDRPLVRGGRYVALTGALVTPILFVIDLHVRKRWYNMLRVFRSTSTMSIGSWSLCKFGLFSTLTAVAQALEDRGYRRTGRVMGRFFQLPASIAGAFSSLYMGTELEETSTPVWAAGFPHLPALFASANASLAGATLAAIGHAQGLARHRVQRLQGISALTGAYALTLLGRIVKNQSKALPGQCSDYSTGGSSVMGAGLAALTISRLLPLVRQKSPRPPTIAGLAARLALGLLGRGMLVHAGNYSAREPALYFRQTETDYGRDGREGGRLQRGKPRRGLALGIALIGLGSYFFLKIRKDKEWI